MFAVTGAGRGLSVPRTLATLTSLVSLTTRLWPLFVIVCLVRYGRTVLTWHTVTVAFSRGHGMHGRERHGRAIFWGTVGAWAVAFGYWFPYVWR